MSASFNVRHSAACGCILLRPVSGKPIDRASKPLEQGQRSIILCMVSG